MKKIFKVKTRKVIGVFQAKKEEVWSDERLDALHQVNMADTNDDTTVCVVCNKTYTERKQKIRISPHNHKNFRWTYSKPLFNNTCSNECYSRAQDEIRDGKITKPHNISNYELLKEK